MNFTALLTENQWSATLLVALVAVIVAQIVQRIGRMLLLRVTRSAPMLRAIVLACDAPSRVALPLIALQAVWAAASDELARIGTVRHANGVLLIFALTWLAMRAIRGVADALIASNPVDAEDNLGARRIQTQARVLSRSAMLLVLLGGTAMALMTFPGARQFGASLLASAGVLGIIGGLAARPVFSNLIAGLQLALAQPLRIDDVVIVKGEWGRVEEITGTYVVLKIWDERRLIVPLQWFIENPFENWTRTNSQVLGSVMLYLDFTTPMAPLRAELERVVGGAEEWDGRVCGLQVTDTTDRAMQVRILVSAASAGKAFDLRCKVREAMLAFIARELPESLPRLRVPQAEEPSRSDDRSAAAAGAQPT